MEIYLDRRAVRHLRLATQEAIEEGDIEALRDDVVETFTEEQVEEIERRLDTADFFEFVTDVLDEWGGDDVDELFELLDTQLSEVGVDLKTHDEDPDDDEEEEEEDDGDEFLDDEDSFDED